MELILGNHLKTEQTQKLVLNTEIDSVAQSAAVYRQTSWLTTSLRR